MLALRRDPAAVAELSRVLAGDPDPALRAQAAAALGSSADPSAVAALTAALQDQVASVRLQALRGLHRLQPERAAEPLARVLQTDPDPRVRRTAALTLGGLSGDVAAAALRAAAMDSDATVRQAAAAALARWQRQRR